MAWALGYAHPDHLRATLTWSQWMGWLAWMKIRGPIGPQRQDFYAAYVALHSGRQYDDKATVERFVASFPMPWVDLERAAKGED